MGTSKHDPLKQIPVVKVDLADILNFKPMNNHVLLRQHSDNTFIKFNDTHLQIDPSWRPEFHVDRVFTVVAVPDKLMFYKNSENTMHWKTEMQLKVGDRVWVNYLRSIRPVYRMECEGDKYIVVHYEAIYLALRTFSPPKHRLEILFRNKFLSNDNITLSVQRDVVYHPPMVKFDIELIDDAGNPAEIPENVVQETTEIINNKKMSYEPGYRMKATFLSEVVMINGFVMFEMDPTTKSRIITMQDTFNRQFHIGNLRFYGRPNEFYAEKTYNDDNYVGSPGQVLHLKFGNFVQLEDPVHKIFPWEKPLFVSQRRYIVGVFKNENI